MTINIALVTREAVIFGCDSLSSSSEWAFFPFRDGAEYAKDSNGDFLSDSNGNKLISVPSNQIHSVVSTVFDGARKLFCICEEGDIKISAVTSGLAAMKSGTIAEIAQQYKKSNKGEIFTTVDEVANSFLSYMRKEWEKEFQFDHIPEEQKNYLPDLNFIVGGFGKNDTNGKIFDIEVKQNRVSRQFSDESPYGICWAGQTEFVQRLLNGADSNLIFTVNKEIVKSLINQRSAILESFSKSLTDAGVQIPEGLELNITETLETTLPWNLAAVGLDIANLPLQHAIDFASLLVNTQSGIQKFATGIPTVGGRTHIGLLMRGEKFRMLNEQDLMHTHTGYLNDI